MNRDTFTQETDSSEIIITGSSPGDLDYHVGPYVEDDCSDDDDYYTGGV